VRTKDVENFNSLRMSSVPPVVSPSKRHRNRLKEDRSDDRTLDVATVQGLVAGAIGKGGR
jgi:IS5 family transposase